MVSQQKASVEAFCWVHDGVEPHLLPSHLTAFSATADAIDFYIDTPVFGVVLHNN